jgi:hypothetical protein
MPLDGQMRTGFVSLEDMLLDMVEFALDGGKKWTKRTLKVGNKRCLLGAVRFVRHETGYGPDHTEKYLARAINGWAMRRNEERFLSESTDVLAGRVDPSVCAIMAFNDAEKRTFRQVVEVIRDARELAQVDAYVAEMERNAGRSANPDPAVRRLAVELAGMC